MSLNITIHRGVSAHPVEVRFDNADLQLSTALACLCLSPAGSVLEARGENGFAVFVTRYRGDEDSKPGLQLRDDTPNLRQVSERYFKMQKAAAEVREDRRRERHAVETAASGVDASLGNRVHFPDDKPALRYLKKVRCHANK